MDRLNREILRLSIPTIVSNITVPLLGICDTAISGHLGSELFLSSIAVASVMLNVVFWIFGFLRGGTTGLTANALGEGSEKDISKVLYRSLIIAGCAGGMLILLQIPVFKFLWMITGSDGEIKEYVKDYFEIRIWGSPALLATMAISGWFVGMQTTFYPMLIAILMNVINIGASCLLVFGYNAGFNGVAVGTLISNWLGLGISIICLLWFSKNISLKCSFSNLIKGSWLRYFSVNGNLFLRSFFIICVTMGVTAAGARIGNLTLAVNAIIMQYFLFFSFFMDGFAFSGEAMIGLRKGERNYEMLDKSVKRLLQWTLGTGVIFSLIYLCASGLITGLLTDSESVREGVNQMNVWIILIPVVSCWAFIYDGFYIGITDTYNMMISALIGGALFFGVLCLNYFDIDLTEDRNNIIWLAFLIYLLARGVYLATLWRSRKKLVK